MLFLLMPSLPALATEDKEIFQLAMSERTREELLLFFDEEDLIITATKHPQKISDAPAIATTITAEEIRNMGARTLLDALQRIPGVQVRNGNNFVQGRPNVEIRGMTSFTSERVLFLVDGHRFGNVMWGSDIHGYAGISVENIKRIEVIRGPGSALYGTNAFVGVINIVTKDAADINGADINTGYGSYDTKRYSLLYGKEYSKLKVVGSFGLFDSDGPSEWVEKDAYLQSGKTDEWSRSYDAGLKLSYGELAFQGRYINHRKGTTIGVGLQLNDESIMVSDNIISELSYRHSFSDKSGVLWKAYFDRFQLYSDLELVSEGLLAGYPDGMIGKPEFKNQTLGTELQFDFKHFEKHALTVGALYEEYLQYGVRSWANFDPNTYAPLGSVQDLTDGNNYNQNKSRIVHALYLQDLWKITKDLDATLGIRYDKYSDFGDTTNPRLGFVWRATDVLNLKLLYGSAFRAPIFLELYNTNNPVSWGNPDLDPEEIDTYEAALGYKINADLQMDLSYFYSRITDAIIKGGIGDTYKNSDRYEIEGIEVDFKYNLSKKDYFYINYTYQEPEDSKTGDLLEGAIRNKGNVGVNLAFGDYVNINSNMQAVGERVRVKGDPRDDLPGYEVVDLSIIFKNFFNGLELRGSVYNLFDEKYREATKYGTLYVDSDQPAPGRSTMLELRDAF